MGIKYCMKQECCVCNFNDSGEKKNKTFDLAKRDWLLMNDSKLLNQ